MPRRQVSQYVQAVDVLTSEWLKPPAGVDRSAARAAVLAVWPNLVRLLDVLAAQSDDRPARYLCPSCRRLFAAGTRVPRDPTGRVQDCRDCSNGIDD